MRLTAKSFIAAGTLAALIVGLLLGGAGLWVSGATGQQQSKLTAELDRAVSRAFPAERVPVLIELERVDVPRPLAFERELRAAEQASNLAALYSLSFDRLGGELSAPLALELQAGEVLWIGGAARAELTPAEIRELEGSAGVRRVHYDGLVLVELAGHRAVNTPLTWGPGFVSSRQDPAGGLPWGLEAIGAPEVWAAGATGEGTVVAILDSGVDGEHPLLSRKWRGRRTPVAESWFDPWGLSELPFDDDGLAGVGHGTIVATVAVGSLEPGDTLVTLGQPEEVQGPLEVVTGVAPGAEWVAANAFQIFGAGTYTRLSVLLQGMQWVLDPDGDPATVSDVPNVLNNSWGFRPGGCDGIFDRAIDALEAAGVPVVFSAGNRQPGFDTVAAPAERADLLLNAFSVGAAERRGEEIVVAENSLGGPTPCAPGSVKPEVVAPGEAIAVRNLGSRTAGAGGRTGPFTSWAAPYVAGSLAVLAGLDPAAGANELKSALFSTAVDLPPPGPDNRSGGGIIDLAAAAERVGGLGGVRLVLADWSWDSGGTRLGLELRNRGGRPFPGGSAELRSSRQAEPLALSKAPAIGPQGRGAVQFTQLPAEVRQLDRLELRLESEGAALSLPVQLLAATPTSETLESGSVRFSLDANGRLGRVAGRPGFEFLGDDWLTGGSLLFGREMQVSDAAYVDVLQQPTLKANPVGSDTDWQRIDAGAAEGSPDFAFSDRRALRPLGATVHQWVDLVSIGDSAAFVALTARLSFGSSSAAPLAGLLLDWDFAGRDSVAWDDDLSASLMTPADSNGPWLALAVAGRSATTHAAVPLGRAEAGFYATGSGVLSGLDGFTDEAKAQLLRLGGAQRSSASVTDWAQLLTVGPLRDGEATTFIIAAGGSRAALAGALDSARAFAGSSPGGEPRAGGPDGLQLLPPYPNPFDPTAGEVVNLPYLIDRGADPLEARLEIYTISGRLIHEERRQLIPGSPVAPFRWSGRSEDGEPAASGVYGYVIRVGRERELGKLVLLK
ncbi:MAG: S8 family serine peptidase [Gemmatimonadota bacterium]|nr:MAG: S8 family serine peptidase [Gemmatimonadota bacterium]